jgi:membrane dipeptidase
MIDLHCDTVSRMLREQVHLGKNQLQFDTERAQAVGSVLQVMALFSYERNIDAHLRAILEQIAYLHREAAEEPGVYLVHTAADIQANPDKIGLLLHLEGGECLGGNLLLLDILYDLGLRSLGLTWNHRNMLADGVEETAGLTQLGRDLIAECNRRRIIVDLAHCAFKGAVEALEISTQPVMISHANAWHICQHRRNIQDEVLQKLKQNGGIIGVTYVDDFVFPEPVPGIKRLVQHLLYLSEKIGIDHIALGSDFDGADDMAVPDVSACPLLREALLQHDFSAGEVDKIFTQNARRFLQTVLPD